MKSIACHRHKNKNGFTLVELIMTIIVTSIIAIPLSLLISQHVESTFQSEDYMMATNLARFDMEKAKNIGYAGIGTGVFNYPNYQGYNYDITRTVTVVATSGTEGLKQIKVEAKKAGSATVLARLFTYLENNVGYGP